MNRTIKDLDMIAILSLIVLGFTPQYPRLCHSERRLLWLHFSARFPARPPSLPRAQAVHNSFLICYVQAERKQSA
jgi:hypothetical protein